MISGRKPTVEAPEMLDAVAFAVVTNPVALPIEVVSAPVSIAVLIPVVLWNSEAETSQNPELL